MYDRYRHACCTRPRVLFSFSLSIILESKRIWIIDIVAWIPLGNSNCQGDLSVEKVNRSRCSRAFFLNRNENSIDQLLRSKCSSAFNWHTRARFRVTISFGSYSFSNAFRIFGKASATLDIYREVVNPNAFDELQVSLNRSHICIIAAFDTDSPLKSRMRNQVSIG